MMPIAVTLDAEPSHLRFEGSRHLVDQRMMDLAIGDIDDAVATSGKYADLRGAGSAADGEAGSMAKAAPRSAYQSKGNTALPALLSQEQNGRRSRVTGAKPWATGACGQV